MTGAIEHEPERSPRLDADAYELSLVSLLNAVLAERRKVVLITAGLLVAAITIALVSRPTFTATASFTPQTRRPTTSSNIAGFAAQLGISVPGADASLSPAYYAELLKSRQILSAVVRDRYTVRANNGEIHTTFDRIVGDAGADSARRLTQALDWLQDHIHTVVDQRTGIITVSVSAASASLAFQLASRILEELGRFNVEVRQSQAAAERTFAEARLSEAADSLRLAENVLQEFIQRNRDWKNAPDLAFDYDRLSRRVTFRQELYTALAQSYEQAKIEEVRDTPVFTVTDQPMLPVDPDSRKILPKSIVAILFGFAIGAMLAILKRKTALKPEFPLDESAELRYLWRETLSDLRRPWTLILGRRQPRSS